MPVRPRRGAIPGSFRSVLCLVVMAMLGGAFPAWAQVPPPPPAEAPVVLPEGPAPVAPAPLPPAPSRGWYRRVPPRAPAEPKEYSYRPFELSLFYPVCIFHPKHKIVGGLSLNILHGRAARVYGLEIGGIVNHETERFGGLQLAGVVNWVSGSAGGIQLAGVWNWVGRDFYGLQLSVANFAKGTCYGLCLSAALNAYGGVGGLAISLMNWVGREGGGGLLLGGGNFVEGGWKGIQVSPIMNMVYGDFTGIQISMLNINNRKVVYHSCVGNVCRGTATTYFRAMNGLQISLGNMAYGVFGVQLSGILNIAFNKMHGFQLSPLFNMAGPTRGVQVSAINWADSLRGLQIGLINIAGRLSGVQIGAINIAYKNRFPFMIGVLAGAN